MNHVSCRTQINAVSFLARPMRRRRKGTGWVVGLAVAAAVNPTADLRASEQLKPKVEEKVRHSTLFVKTYQSKRSKNDTPHGAGSGFFINSTGLMISNNHVVDPTHDPYDEKWPEEKHRFHYEGGKLSWTVTADSGTSAEKTYDATVIYQNEQADQALMQVHDKDGNLLSTPNYLALQPESRLRKRTSVWGVGFPGADTQGTREKAPAAQIDPGNTIDLPRSPGGRIRKVYTDVVVRPGNSGGPQVDQDGLVVGTATQMTPPEGREDTGGARYTALVPAALTAEMIRNAYRLKKIPPGTDFTPFLDFLSGQGGRIDLPEFDRRGDAEVLFYANGDRVYGKFLPEELKFETELGTLKIPSTAIAYLMTGEGSTTVHLEGGNRISVSKIDESFGFEPQGGSKLDVKYTDIRVISFRTAANKAGSVTGKVVVVDGNLCRLLLSKIEGAAKFTGAAGTLDIKLEDIDRIETASNGDRIVILRDERRMTGKFEPAPFKATIAATGTPIEIQLSQLEQGFVDTRFLTGRELGGLGLVQIVEARADFKRIAQALESNTPDSAKASLDKLMDKTVSAKMPPLEKDQLKLLDAVYQLRAGKYADALKGFRGIMRSEDKNVAVYAAASASVLKKYESGQCNGKPLSDRMVFADAGAEIARGNVHLVRDAIKELRSIDGEGKNDLIKISNTIKNSEENIAQAGVFLGTIPEDLMLRLWKIGQSASIREYRKLAAETGEGRQGRGGGGNRPAVNITPQRMREIEQRLKKVREVFVEYIQKRFDYGFFVEDIDIEELQADHDEQQG